MGRVGDEPGGDLAPEEAVGRGKAAVEAHLIHAAGEAHARGDAPGLLQRRGHRLLREHVQPAVERLEHHGPVVAVRQGDVDRVWFQIGQLGQGPARPGPEGLGRRLRGGLHRIGDADDPDARIAREHVEVPPAHPPGSHQSDLYRHA